MSLGRAANIAANGSPVAGDTYVAYSYLGASMVVDAYRPAPLDGRRDRFSKSRAQPPLIERLRLLLIIGTIRHVK